MWLCYLTYLKPCVSQRRKIQWQCEFGGCSCAAGFCQTDIPITTRLQRNKERSLSPISQPTSADQTDTLAPLLFPFLSRSHRLSRGQLGLLGTVVHTAVRKCNHYGNHSLDWNQSCLNRMKEECTFKYYLFVYIIYHRATSQVLKEKTNHTCEVRFESWGGWSCSGAIVIISSVPILSSILPPLGHVPTEKQFVYAVG